MNLTQAQFVKKCFPDGYLHHIGIALPETQQLSQILSHFFPFRVSPVKEMPAQGIRVMFLEPQEHCRIPEIEIITPLGENSPIHKFLAKHPSGALHHLCFAVGNLIYAIEKIRAHGHDIIAPPREGAHGKPIVFIHPRTTKGLLIELCPA